MNVAWASSTSSHISVGSGAVSRPLEDQRVVGFAFTELLNFSLLPRLKNMGSIRLYRPDDGPPGWLALGGSLTRAIRWDLIAQQHDQIQVRHCPPPGHRGGRAGAAALHPRRIRARHVPGPRRAGARGSHDLRVWAPRRPRPAPGDPRRTPGRGELEQGYWASAPIACSAIWIPTVAAMEAPASSSRSLI